MADTEKPQACCSDKGCACTKSNNRLLLWAALIAGALAVIGAVMYQNAVNDEPPGGPSRAREVRMREAAKAQGAAAKAATGDAAKTVTDDAPAAAPAAAAAPDAK